MTKGSLGALFAGCLQERSYRKEDPLVTVPRPGPMFAKTIFRVSAKKFFLVAVGSPGALFAEKILQVFAKKILRVLAKKILRAFAKTIFWMFAKKILW